VSPTPRTAPLRVAVIGCGAISPQHLSFLRDCPDTDLVAVCDRSRATVDYAARTYGAAATYLEPEPMLESERCDVVHVLTPPRTHATLVDLSSGAGAHVVCEKPLAPCADEARRLLDLVASRDRTLVESHNLLWNDPILAIDRLVADGTLGSIREVDVTLALDLTAGPFGDLNLEGPGVDLPGGAVHDFLPHLAYLFLHFADHVGPADSVVGSLRNVSLNPRVGFDHLDAVIEAGQVRGRLHVASDLRPDQFRIWVRGTAGTVAADLYNPFLRIEGGRDVGKRAPIEQVRSGVRLGVAAVANLRNKVMQHSTYHGFPRMLADVYESFRTGSPSPIPAADILATAELCDQLVDLAETSR
jgi:predicted dehydrogenase